MISATQTLQDETRDAIVVGGGLVGAAIAYGLQRQGLSTLMLDEGDIAHRASRGNFGLIWVQSKGLGAPHYQHWTHGSAQAWPGLAEDLSEATGIGVGLHQPGGLHFCFSDAEMAQRDALMGQLRREAGNAGYEYRMLSVAELRDMVPGLGPKVVGASWTPYDGHASPLHLLRALHAAFQRAGGHYRPNARVEAVTAAPHDFSVSLGTAIVRAPRLVLASGLGNADLAPLVGLAAPLRPERGQILVTERTREVLALPTHVVRQTDEGSLLLGDSKEDMGFDTLSQTPAIMRAIAQRAVQTFPWIAELNIVRAWAALRVMSPDGKPIYDESERCPGAFLANCHSGVTLAGAHAHLLAPMIAAGALAPEMSPFSARRFDVQKAA
ncbi:FAD-binding oxidoreductase [Methylobacterium sp. J-001]|uniref:NAD(P)/FAD-dependent oxidoreductase n=1 Tax=Methylobacterium sp. J-001 TaxID=2836609 RepID=UPI001FBB63AC|nr:FAD-dependent oxidoreductase [Methylobacterium sp. J-001]MCJ2115194.1 FAD-binding oxidoreductase [Methylobacterium sp. J-001]